LTKQDILFIINPIAGNGNFGLDDSILEACNKHCKKGEIWYTHSKGHASALAIEGLKIGFGHFVAIGGDGTVNEVAKELINKNVIFSIIPLGSGNGLARFLQLPLHFSLALEKVFTLHTMKIDAGTINNLPFFCTAGLGFDAQCAADFDQEPNSRGLVNYIRIILKRYFGYTPQRAWLDGTEQLFFSITFANANQFGNNAYIAPDARIDDNLLDCTVIYAHPKWMGVLLGFLLMRKQIAKSKFVNIRRARHFRVVKENNLLIHLDGEPLALNTSEAVVEVLPHCLTITI
jgi:diacylglycerol kinase (ATP)